MKYDAALVEHLAAQYVLGTLRGAARRRFDRLITDKADIRFVVWRWERYLNGFASGLQPRSPRRQVWTDINQRIELSQATKTPRVSRWRGYWLALPTAVAAAWLAITFWSTPAVEHIAVFADQNVETLWVISADLDNGALRTETVNAPPLTNNTSYELWVLPSTGSPLSLGLMPVNAGSTETRVSAQLVAALRESGRLAISIEPAGGSPTGLPTGPVVYQASLVTI